MAIRQALSRGERVVGTNLEKLVEEVLTKSRDVDVRLVELVLRNLRAGRVLGPAFMSNVKRIDELLQSLPRLARMFEVRLHDVTHLFGDGLEASRTSALKSHYLRELDELRAFANGREFEHLLATPATRARIDADARGMMQGLGGIVDRYGDLKRESYACNSLTRRLYPRAAVEAGILQEARRLGLPMPSPKEMDNLAKANRLDAQHVIEKRTFKVFEKEWNLLGWRSIEDMPAMAIMHEWHIPSPKNLPGMRDMKLIDDAMPIEDVFSLTKEMERDLPLENFNTAEDYLKALKKFYGFSKTNKRGDVVVQPLASLVEIVEKVQTQLVRARNNPSLIKKLKKIRSE